jgi:hypothetical protein
VNGLKHGTGGQKMAHEKRLIDANAFQFEPDPVDNIMNGVLFMGRSTGKTLQMVKYCLQAMIENAPTVDAVEVVRCKDCKHWGYVVGCGHYCECYANQMADTEADDFCSYGERKDNG